MGLDEATVPTAAAGGGVLLPISADQESKNEKYPLTYVSSAAITSSWLPAIRPSLAAITPTRWRANRGQSQTVAATEPTAATVISAMNSGLVGPMTSAPQRLVGVYRAADPVQDAGHRP